MKADACRYVKRLQICAGGSLGTRTNRCELDSHADTCTLGGNFLLVEEPDPNRRVTVNAFSASISPIKGIPIATGAGLWRHPESGQGYILLFNEALFFGNKLKGPSLLNPTQMRFNGLVVDDVLKQFDPDSSHSIYDPRTDVSIPLDLNGVHSGFTCTKPSWEEYRNLPKIEMTSTHKWEPMSDDIPSRERHAMAAAIRVETVDVDNDVDVSDVCVHPSTDNHGRYLSSVKSFQSQAQGLDMYFESPKATTERMIGSVNVSIGNDLDDFREESVEVSNVFSVESFRNIWAVNTVEERSTITPEVLQKKWGLGLDTAKRTLRVTTQAGMRNVLAPGERKLRHRTDHLRFPNLRGRFYTDTMYAKRKSARGFMQAQIFTDGHGFDCFYPQIKESDASEKLVRFIQEEGIPQILISDNAKAQVQGMFQKVCNRIHIQEKQVIPGHGWRNL